MEEAHGCTTGKGLATAQEPGVTIHYAENGPSLESCMISVLSSHLPFK